MSKGKKVALALGVAALVAGASRIPYRAVSVAGAKPPAAPYALPPAREGLRLHVFNTGANRVSSLLVGANPPWRPAPAFVIQHPVHGSIVFDLGLSQAVAERGEAALDAPMRWLFQSRGRVGRTLEAQMREVGLEPADVRWVIVSHLHEDHLGAASAFTKATFVGGAGVSAHRFGLADEPRWREVDFAQNHCLRSTRPTTCSEIAAWS